ncbi:hypothetical protein KZX47_08925 [Thermus sp. SYSU G05001]|uniref:Transposase n=1 Tax=Thermus brevis TaxID=2862456 RepID=A0ABS6ZZ19_9DEIN|nr:hypothetical protein [Thermus brevis]MBW6395268.1 hypothetical protein [Thermus brevis]
MPLWKAVRRLCQTLISRSSWTVEVSPEFDEALKRLEERFQGHPEALQELRARLRELVYSLQKWGDLKRQGSHSGSLAPEASSGLRQGWELLKYRTSLDAPVPNFEDRWVRIILVRVREKRWIYLWMPYTHLDFRSRPQDSRIKGFIKEAEQKSPEGEN